MNYPDPIKENRLGKFTIDRILLEDYSTMRQVMDRVIVVRAEWKDFDTLLEYMAFSWLFDPLEKATLVPTYTFIIEKSIEGYKIRVKK